MHDLTTFPQPCPKVTESPVDSDPSASGTCPLNELRTTRKYYTPGNARAIRRRRRIEVEEGKAVKDERGREGEREGESEGLMEGKRGVI